MDVAAMAPKKGSKYLKPKQIANIILAARGQSKCPAAKKYVKKIDNKYNLKKRR